MVKAIARDHVFFAFSPDLIPVAKVQQGEEFVLHTHDCFEGQLKSSNDLVTALDWNHVNPATGPVFIKGAKPGDILKVDLLKVDVKKTSIMVALPGEGALGDVITEMETTMLHRKGKKLFFKDKVGIPKAPMIGVIGVAPAEGAVPNGTPGPHGGNMDCRLIAEGNSIYFTVGVEGALFGAGDLHAAMGDGEIVVCGAETAGKVRFEAEVVDLPGLPTPFLETPEAVATIYSAPTLDEAVHGAIYNMSTFLTQLVKIPLNDAGMLMSVAGELKFCQVVDPQKTIRFEFPKAILKKYKYKF